MAGNNIEDVAILYLDEWIQIKKIENHDRKSGSNDIDFLWSDAMARAPSCVQKFYDVLLNLKFTVGFPSKICRNSAFKLLVKILNLGAYI